MNSMGTAEAKIVMSVELGPSGSEGTWWVEGNAWSISSQVLITIYINKPLLTDQKASLFVQVETFSKRHLLVIRITVFFNLLSA